LGDPRVCLGVIIAAHGIGGLIKIKPFTAAFDHNFVKLIDGPNIKKGKNKYELALQIKDDIAAFKKTSGADRLVACWCGSTESFPDSCSGRAWSPRVSTLRPRFAPFATRSIQATL